MKGQTQILFNKDTANFHEIEEQIIKLLTEDLRAVRGNAEVKLKQNAEEVLSLSKVMQNRFKTRCSVEYFFYLIEEYTNRDYKNTSKVILRFLDVLNLRCENMPVVNLYRTYKKLIFHRIQDKKYNNTENEDVQAYNGVSFIKSYGQKAVHLI